MMNFANQVYSWFSNDSSNIKNLANNEILLIANELNGLFSEINDNNHKISLPKIVVVGTQSSGKSTVLNAIMALDILPTGKNMVTRTPLDIRLHKNKSNEARIELGYYSDNGWVCEKSIKLSLPNATKEEIDLIRQYISVKTNELAGDQMNISKSPIYLQIFSPNVPDLSLVDLPGLVMVACTDKGQPANMPEQIEKLVESYIKDQNTITLAVMQSRSDLETDLGLALIKKYKCSKTIGVLTKPDLMNNDSHVGNYLCSSNISKDLMLDYGYFVVKNKSSLDNEEYDINKLIEMEKKYFANHWEYNKSIYQNKVGYNSLIRELTKILINAIRETMPNAFQKLADIELDLMKKQSMLGRNPPTTKETQLVELNTYLNNFNKVLNDCIESNGTLNNMGKDIKLCFDQYRLTIDNINPFIKDNLFDDNYFKDMITGFEGYHLSSFVSPITLLERCITDNKFKPILTLKKPSNDCLDDISKILTSGIQKILLQEEFSKYPLLANLVIRQVIEDLIVPNIKKSEKQIEDLLQFEIDYIWTDNSKFIEMLSKYSITNKEDLNNLRSLLSSYFDTIKENIKHNVPKIIMSLVIRNIQKNMIIMLGPQIANENKISLLKEDPKIEDERKYCNSILEKIQTIKKIVETKINN